MENASTPSDRYPPGTVRGLIESDLVTPPTRRALQARLQPSRTAAPRAFDPHAFAVVRAACDRLVPQPERAQPIDIATEFDRRLADGPGDGWRYAHMPPDPDMHRAGVVGLDHAAMASYRRGFVELAADEQDAVLDAVQRGQAPGEVWATMDATRYFEELLLMAVDIYYAHPLAQEEIGYAGMADARGWRAIRLGEREAHEPQVSDVLGVAA